MTNAVNDHLKPSDVQGAWLEARGLKTAAEEATGRPFKHDVEVNAGLRGLINGIKRLRGKVGDLRISASDRAIAEEYLSAASNLADFVDEALKSSKFPAYYRPSFKLTQSVQPPESVPDTDLPIELDLEV